MEPISPLPPDPIPSGALTIPEQLKDDLRDLLENELLSEEDRKELRDSIVDKVNGLVNIPIIGESVERALISFLFKVAERTIIHYARRLIGI